MANNNRKFVVSLEIDSKTAEQQIKTSSKNIEKILANIGNASDKITYFKGLVDEISNVDQQLADFKAKYGEKMFVEMFGTFGTDLENKLQSTIGMSKQQLSMLDDLYGKKNKLQQTLDALDNKPIKIDTTQDNDVKIISELIEQYRVATKEWASSNPNSTTDEINKLIAERTRLASLLANTSDYVIEYGSDDAAELITLNDKVITEAQDFLKDFYIKSQNTANEIRQVSKDLVNNIDTDISKVMTNPKAQSNVYDELYKKTKKYLDLQKQLGDENISDEDYNKAFDDVSTIENEIAVLGELKGKAEEVKNIFARFNNSEIADDNLLDELTNTLGVEIPQSVQKTEGSFNQVGKQVIEATEYVKGLEAAIRNMFDAASKQSEIEYKILINGQDIDARNGSVDTVSLKTSAEAYLANLTKDVDVDVHSHQGKSANINTYDFSSAINKYYSGLAKMSAIISDKDILTLDLTKVKAEDAFKALAKVKEILGQSKLSTIKPEQLNNIFNDIDSSYTDIVKKWEPTKFSELAQYIYDIKQNSEQVSTPLERFKNLLMSITGGKIDFSKYTKQLNNFSTDNVEKLFNEIMKLENITEDGKLLQVDDKVIQGSIENITRDIQRQKDEYLQLRQTAKLTYEDIRAEIYKYMSTGDRSFFNKYYHKSDDMRLADDFTELADGNLDINSLTNKIAVDFGIEPREIQSVEQVSDAYKDLKSSLPNADDFKKTFTPDDDQIRKVRELADEYRIIMSLLSKDMQENNLDNYTYNAIQERAKAINDVIQKVRPNDASMDFISDYYGASPETTRAVKDWRTADEVRMGHYNESIIADESRQRAIDLINQQKQAHKENAAAIKEEIVVKSNLNNIDYDDAAADIARENGQLEEKLELLREIADQYGVNITNTNRDRYEELNQKDMNDGLTSREEDRFSELGDKIEEADANLEELGATYDKITLKFANGKTKDIFPDDKGLRALYKYADSLAYDEFNGKEIEDVIFTRKQEQEIIEQINQDLQEQVSIQKRVNEVSDNKPNKEVTAEIEEQNEALQRQKALYEYIERANQEKRKVSETTLGVTDAVYKDFDEDYNLVEKSTLDIIKKKQKVLKQYLNELVQIEQQERENGQLTEKEIVRHKELVRLIEKMQLSVRYKDGTNYSTSDFDSLHLSESINKLNEVINLRKKIELGYYGTGKYGTIADTYNGINISDLLYEGSRSFDFDIREFDQSVVGRLIREYQDLHEEMLKCLLVGEEVPQTTLDRLKWFESLDSSKLDEIIPKLTELRNKINEFDDYETGIDKQTKTLQDESYYDEKISKLQEFLDVKQKYLELGGPTEEFGDHWSIDDIEGSINRTIELRDNLKEVQRLKNEFSEIHPDVDLENDEEYINILRRLQIGNDNYSNSLKSMNAVYEKRNKDAINAVNVLRQEASAQEELNNSQKDVQNHIDNTAEEARENAEATEKEAASHRENADAIRDEERAQDELNQQRTETKDADTSEEITQLERLKSTLNEVEQAIKAKTDAFELEGKTVGEVVSKETITLDTLSTYLDTIYIVINNIIDGLNRINNTKLNDIQDKESKAATDQDNTTNSNIQDTTNKYALDSTLSTTNSILQSILTAVNSGESTNQVAEALDSAVADLKAAADALKTNVDNVKQKVKDDAKDKIKDTSTDLKKEKTFDDIKNTEVGNFEQYKKDVENSIYVTDEFRDRLLKLGAELNNISDAKGLDTWKQSVSVFKDEFSRYEDANKKVLIGQINTIKKEAKDAMKGLDLDVSTNDPEKRAKQEEIAQGFKEIQIASDICTNKIKNNQNAEIDALNKTKQQLLENIYAYKKENDLLNSGGKSGKNYGNTAIIRETTRYNQLQQYATDADAGFKDSGVFNNKLQEYINAYNKLIAVREKLASKPVLTDRDVQEFNDAKQAAANYGKELERMITKSQKLASNSFQMGIIGSDIDVDDALGRKQALTDFVTQIHDANESTIKFSNNYQECMFKMKNSDGTWTRMTAVLDKTSNKMYSTAGEVTKYGTAIGEFVGALKGEFLKLGRYMIASFGFEEVVQAFRTGITYVKEIDDALTELKKVTNETDAGYERFLQTMSKTAAVVGSTVAELTTMAAEWARLGYSMQQAASLAESTAILLNVSEFEDPTEASEALISTIQAFGYAADDSMHVVDVLNEVGEFIASR